MTTPQGQLSHLQEARWGSASGAEESVQVTVVVEDSVAQHPLTQVLRHEDIVRLVHTACHIVAFAPRGALSLSIVLMDDATIQAYNTRFRNQAQPTNVLSFPATPTTGAFTSQGPQSVPLPGEQTLELGDILISLPYVAREALTQRLDARAHATHMVVHGFLHLLHYDHQTEAEAEVMEGFESQILTALGFDDPYGPGSGEGDEADILEILREE